jgi:hypothetical protein
MNCQKCRQPLRLDGSLENLNPAAYDLLVCKSTCLHYHYSACHRFQLTMRQRPRHHHRRERNQPGAAPRDRSRRNRLVNSSTTRPRKLPLSLHLRDIMAVVRGTTPCPSSTSPSPRSAGRNPRLSNLRPRLSCDDRVRVEVQQMDSRTRATTWAG